jgi:hypothetical protein
MVKSPHYRVPYAVFGCLSILVSLVSLVQHVNGARELRAQIKANAEIQPTETDTDLEDGKDNAGLAVVHKLEWELEKASRDLKGLAVGVLSLVLEDLPMVRAAEIPTKIRRIG